MSYLLLLFGIAVFGVTFKEHPKISQHKKLYRILGGALIGISALVIFADISHESPAKPLLKKLITKSFEHYRKEFIGLGDSLIEMVEQGAFNKEYFNNYCRANNDLFKDYSKLRESLTAQAKEKNIYDDYFRIIQKLQEGDTDCIWLPVKSFYHRLDNLCKSYKTRPQDFKINYEIFKKKFLKYKRISEGKEGICLRKLDELN